MNGFISLCSFLSSFYGDSLSSFTNVRSCPPSQSITPRKEGMIHLLVRSYVQKPDSGLFSDWSNINTFESVWSDCLSYFNETFGEKLMVMV